MKYVFKLLGLLIIVIVIWFSFFKPFDHQIQFKVNLVPGSIYDLLQNIEYHQSIVYETTIEDELLFSNLTQSIILNDKPFELFWEFSSLTDTTTQVNLFYKNTNNSLSERYLSLIGLSKNRDTIKEIAKQIKLKSQSISKTFKVRDIVFDTIPAATYLYVNLEAKRHEKALKMISNNHILFAKNQDSLAIKSGNTFIKVDLWQPESDTIQFRYAFPIMPQAVYPIDDLVKVDSMKPQPALKATFYGNYSKSDHAWMVLYQFAIHHNIEVILSPVEIFYNNPILGGDDTKWKAEIYLPLKTF